MINAPTAEVRLLNANANANANALLPLYFYTARHPVSERIPGFEPNPLDRHASRWLHLRR